MPAYSRLHDCDKIKIWNQVFPSWMIACPYPETSAGQAWLMGLVSKLNINKNYYLGVTLGCLDDEPAVNGDL